MFVGADIGVRSGIWSEWKKSAASSETGLHSSAGGGQPAGSQMPPSGRREYCNAGTCASMESQSGGAQSPSQAAAVRWAYTV